MFDPKKIEISELNPWSPDLIPLLSIDGIGGDGKPDKTQAQNASEIPISNNSAHAAETALQAFEESDGKSIDDYCLWLDRQRHHLDSESARHVVAGLGRLAEVLRSTGNIGVAGRLLTACTDLLTKKATGLTSEKED
jgi:hypothetical protein